MNNLLPLVSFIVVARNAGQYLDDMFSDFLAQDYPRENVEFLFVDGQSTDKTRQQIDKIMHAPQGFSFRFLENHKKILATGWNIALKEAKGDIILRIDAHARIPENFIRINVESILAGQDIVGGPVICRLPISLWPRLVAIADNSKFGGGGADFRNPGTARYVDTLAYAAYRKEVFKRIGGYHELLIRNQDNEIHYRMKRAGYRFWFNPEISSNYTPRTEWLKLVKQKFSNGYWVGLVSSISPGCFGLRHFVPLVFLLGLLLSGLLAIMGQPNLVFLIVSVYLLASLGFTVKAVRWESAQVILIAWILPVMFIVMHLSYGCGILLGGIAALVKCKELRAYKVPFPIE
ncbi:MAG: hypothetical protein A2089_11345 [Elusimicrobia bacterium GWD2_63_28]|nr:MAG: hypothetical protein A2089_11345 [Elusimicrobia bacterium GWD2_63_28]